MTYTAYKAPTRRSSNKTEDGQTIYRMDGTVKQVFQVATKQGADHMLVLLVQRPDKAMVVKLAGKARDSFTERKINLGEKIVFGGHFDGQFDLPDENYGFIQASAMFGHYVARPDEPRNGNANSAPDTQSAPQGSAAPAFDQDLDDEIPF